MQVGRNDPCDCFEDILQKLFFEELKNISQSECATRSKDVLRRVERRLGLVQLAAQIRQQSGFDDVSTVRLVRNDASQEIDFVVKDSKVVWLEEPNWFLALVDEHGMWKKRKPSRAFHVTLKVGNFLFAESNATNLKFSEIVGRAIAPVSHWWLFPEKEGREFMDKRRRAIDALENMNLTNVKIFSTKQAVPVLTRSIVSKADEGSYANLRSY